MSGNKKMRVGIDLDGVTCDFLGTATPMLRQMFGRPPEGAVQTAWNFDCLGISPAETEELWARIRETWNFWLQLAPMPGTSRLRDDWRKLEPYFITARVETRGRPVRLQSRLWLRRWFGIPFATVIVTDAKPEFAKKLRLHAFIDDKPETALQMTNICQAYLLDAPYNRELDHPQVKRVPSLNAFLEEVLDVRG